VAADFRSGLGDLGVGRLVQGGQGAPQGGVRGGGSQDGGLVGGQALGFEQVGGSAGDRARQGDQGDGPVAPAIGGAGGKYAGQGGGEAGPVRAGPQEQGPGVADDVLTVATN